MYDETETIPRHTERIRRLMIEDGCPEDQIDNYILDLTRTLKSDFQEYRAQYATFWDYLCSYEADCMANDYIAAKLFDNEE